MSNREEDKDQVDDVNPSDLVSTESDIREKKKPEEVKSEPELDLNDLPEEARDVVKMMISRSRSISASSSLSNPVSEKINTEHISKMLDIAEQDNERGYEDTKQTRLYNLITLIIILIFLGFITVFLGNKDLSTYQDIIRILIIFGGGFGAGYGYKSRVR